MAKTYPAKPRKGIRKRPLLPTLEVTVQQDGRTFHAHARHKSASGHSAAWAARRLAELLGYSSSTDVIYVGTDADGHQRFLLIEVQP